VLALVMSVLAGAATTSCGDHQLRKISAPRGGVQLAYALEHETIYTGKVDVGITRQVEGVGKPIRQAISGEVTLVVLGDATDGGTRVRVTLTSGDLDWALLPASGYSRDQFLRLAIKRLKGFHMPMTIGPRGGVIERPPAPSDVPDELAEVIEAVIDAVALSFVSVPAGKVARGDRWVPAGPGRVETRFKGLFRHVERDESVARLEFEMTKVPIGANEEGERQGSQNALFAVAGYPARIDVEARDFHPHEGMSFRRIQVEWKKGGKALPELAAPRDDGPQDVQVIRDPCNPDYVGPASCEEPDDPEGEDDEGQADDGDGLAEDGPDEDDDADDDADDDDDDDADDDADEDA
jgi:hypothetical protein